MKTASALFDYSKQTEEELSFTEGEKFNVYDLNDPDWLLVSDINRTSFGFIPANYIKIDSPENQQTSYAPVVSPGALAPPPVHPSLVHKPLTPSKDLSSKDLSPKVLPQQELNLESEDEEAPPPMPSRPPTETSPTKSIVRTPTNNDLENEEDTGESQGHKFDGEFFTWYIDEVDGRKKRPVVLSIGQGLIIMKPNTSNPKKLKLKSASSLDNQWRVKDLSSFSNEKKHLFLELNSPSASVELHTGSKDVAEAIVSILADLKGAESAKGLREVARAAKAETGSKNRKVGLLMFDFQAQGEDELMCREGDEVYIINESKSKDWWMCENVDTGKQGVVPSSYIEITGTANLDRLTDAPQRRKSAKESGSSSKGRIVEKSGRSERHHHRGRDEREKIREKDRLQRDKQTTKNDDKADKSMPNYHRVRTWIDSSGSFKVEAEFLGCIEGKIHLHKTNGVKIAVGATKLCLEDLEYVEKVTGTSLESYKEEVQKQNLKRSKSKSSGVTSGSVGQSATAAINDIPPPQPSRPKATTALTQNDPDYDWFEFFLQCGVDIGNCQRYTLNFNREQMDDKILQDITPSLLRTLGLREGDILRVMKFLDAKFDRKKVEEQVAPPGGLFSEPTGALKNNNSSTDISKVNASALPSPLKQDVSQHPKSDHLPVNNSKIEDDAWAVKPAARSSEDLLKSNPQPQTPQYTGALQDLVNIKPLESNAPPSSADKPMPQLPHEKLPSAPALTPIKTGPLIQPGQQFFVQKTGDGVASQPTGLIPVPTGGLIPIQPTGFMPITAQPTGFVPIQQTGMAPQFTFGIIPLQAGAATFTGQVTGGQPSMPQTSFGQSFQPSIVPLQSGIVTMPPTSFGQPMSLQQTGPLVPVQRTGSYPVTSFGSQPQQGPMVPLQRTGGTQLTGGFVPQSNFGQQITGGFMNSNTGNASQNNFGQPTMNQQLTGGLPPVSFGGAPNTFQPNFGQNSFQTGNQPSFQTGNQPNFQTGNQPNFQTQPTFGQPNSQPQSFGFNGMPQQNSMGNLQAQSSFGQPYGNVNNFQSQPSFPPNNFGNFQQQNMNQMTNAFQTTSISSPPTYNQPQQGFPPTSFGQQPQFDGFNSQPFQNQPLQSQPTGAGFGNAPLQSQQTGRRANLQAATADNPFGL